ncbi:hypothetical protein BVRB_5g113780 [Beta vulgaris subsp. vulgaris]|uniref:Uncharacterized protein n=1 Tax=Beta vulgaris subsp. vulgaris TaxID=3555 RepID=A0A0J8F4V7_BETVV|nr:hypothetical protein BVRB_5g113780 [Beta vulgaris subsp. vulgaris]
MTTLVLLPLGSTALLTISIQLQYWIFIHVGCLQWTNV